MGLQPFGTNCLYPGCFKDAYVKCNRTAGCCSFKAKGCRREVCINHTDFSEAELCCKHPDCQEKNKKVFRSAILKVLCFIVLIGTAIGVSSQIEINLSFVSKSDETCK
jgi:hypothetical protein